MILLKSKKLIIMRNKFLLTSYLFVFVALNAISQNWLTTGNTLTGSEKLGSLNNVGLAFYTGNSSQMYLSLDGKLAIGGFALPKSLLHIHEKVKDTCFFRVTSAYTTKGGLLFGLYSNNYGMIKLQELTHFTINTGDANRFTILTDGKIGIGIDSPADQLDIFSGNIRLRSGASINHILTSDANGTGTWKALSLQLTGSTLSIANHNTSVNLSGLFSAGTGLSLSGTTFSNSAPDQIVNLTPGGATSISGTYPNFTITSTDNDQQTLTLNNNRLEISGGNFVDLDVLLDNTDEQILSLIGQNLTISNGNTIDLSPINTDNQNLSLTGNTLNITNGVGVILPEYTAGAGINVTNGVITNELPDQTVTIASENGISVSGTYPNFIIENTKPGDAINIIGNGATSVTGSYPNFTISSTDNNTTYSAGDHISISNGIITNTAPNQTVTLSQGGATSISGTYPNFTISSSDNDQQTLGLLDNVLSISNGNEVNLSPYLDNTDNQDLTLFGNTLSITNGTSVTLPEYTEGTGISVTGSYPNFTINNTLPAQNYIAGSGISIANNIINSVWTKSGNNIHNNNSQNVGIGLTDPKSALHIHGGGVITGSQPDATNKEIVQPPITIATSSLQLTNSITGKNNLDGFILGTLQNIAYIKQFENAPLDFYTNNQKRLTIAGNGNIGIGTTANPSAKFEVNGNVKITDIPVLTQTSDFLTVDANGFIGKRNTASLADNMGNHTATMNINLGDKFLTANGDNKGIKLNGSNDIILFEEGNNGLQIINNGGIPKRRGISIDNDNGVPDNNGNFNFWIHNWQNSAFNFNLNREPGTTTLMTLKQNGNVGINTTNPGAKLEVAHDDASGGIAINRLSTTTAKSQVSFRQNGSEKWSLGTDMSSENKNNFYIWDNTNSAARFFINENGNVGIGYTNPNYKLHVNGIIKAKKILVDQGNWYDHVLKPDYKLMPLDSLEKFITLNTHLPEIPSQDEIVNSGLNIGEINGLLLKKIEELTLYLIEQQKTIKFLKEKVETTNKK